MTDERGDLLTSSQVARLLNVHRNTVARYVRLGQLPAVHLPGQRRRLRIPRSAVEKLLRELQNDR